MGYATNLDFAQRAVWYTESKIDVGASNRREAFYSFGHSVVCVLATRSVKIAVPAGTGLPGWLLAAAAKSEGTGCGNCGEQAAIALVYLFQQLKVRPLDYMARTNADHAFVVIGRQGGSDAASVDSWGAEAVVCDPWDGAAYPASEIPKKMHRSLKEGFTGLEFAPQSYFRAT